MHPEISLNFIPIKATGTDWKAKVMEMTRMFFQWGNNNVSGIVDWNTDEKNKSKDNIYILGEGERYNIENYILDPILL